MTMRPLTPQFSQITVTIDEIDLATRTVHARDKTNAAIQATFRTAPGGTLRVPAQGDLWTCQRIGFQWYLGERIDTVEEHASANEDMTPGDTRVSADGTLHLVADEILYNGSALGVTTWEAFTTDGVTLNYTLSTTPIALSLQMFLNGLLIDPRTVLVNGPTLSFTTAPAAGTFIVYYQSSAAIEPLVLMTSTTLMTEPTLMTRG